MFEENVNKKPCAQRSGSATGFIAK
jgi:hypothetical protein